MASVTISAVVKDAAGATATATAVATQAAATTITIGETAVLTAGDSGNGGLLIVQPATLSVQAVLQSLSFYVTAASQKLVLGIYASNSAGLPGVLVAQTAQFTPKVGWNTVVTTTTPTLNPGTYWLCYFPQSNSLDFVKQDGGVPTAYLIKETFGALPATYPSGASTVVTAWSLYATLNPVAVGPVTVTAVLLNGQSSGTIFVDEPGANAGDVIAAVTVTTVPPGQPPNTPVIIGGSKASLFSITNGGMPPCNLIWATNVPAGSYPVSLSAT